MTPTKAKRIAQKAAELSSLSSESLFVKLARYRSKANAHLRTDPITRQAVRQVLRTRGYVFDSQTGECLGCNSEAELDRLYPQRIANRVR